MVEVIRLIKKHHGVIPACMQGVHWWSIFVYSFPNLHKVQIRVCGRIEEYRLCKLHSDK